MKDQTPKTRSQEHEIEIDAPIEAVWKAITEGEEISRWFADEVRVTPGEGGSYWISWGPGQEGEEIIDVWDPPRRFRLRAKPIEGNPMALPEGVAMIVEYTLESSGGRTVLRLTHSGIPDSPDWDGFYDSTLQGWDMFFRGLRHYLEKHRGRPRANIVIMQPIPGDRASAWERFIGKDGLNLAAALSAAVSTRQPYSTITSFGEQIRGEIIFATPYKIVTMTVENLNDALLSAAFEEMGGVAYFYLTLGVFGLDAEQVDQIRGAWLKGVEQLFPSSESPTAAQGGSICEQPLTPPNSVLEE